MFRIRRAAARAFNNALPPSASIRVVRSRVTVRDAIKPNAFRSFSYTHTWLVEEKSSEITRSDSAQASLDHDADTSEAAIPETTEEVAVQQEKDTSSDTLEASSAPEESARREDPNTLLFIRNLQMDVDTDIISKLVDPFGEVIDVLVPKRESGECKGFGFVRFGTAEQAQLAIQELHQQFLNGQRIEVRVADKKTRLNRRNAPHNRPFTPENPPGKTIFIGNLSFTLTDRELSDAFRDINDVIDIRLAVDRQTGQLRGFAHADFPDVESAQAAMEKLKGTSLHNRRLRIDFARAPADQD